MSQEDFFFFQNFHSIDYVLNTLDFQIKKNFEIRDVYPNFYYH